MPRERIWELSDATDAVGHMLVSASDATPTDRWLKWPYHPTLLLLITQPRSSSEHKLGYFWCIPRAPIDSKDPYTIKVQKCRKEIGQITHVASELLP